MANKITQSQIDEMLRLYEKIGTYSGVAKQMGIAATTVSKYIKEQKKTQKFNPYHSSTITPKPIEEIPFESIITFATMTEEEKNSYNELRKVFA